MADKKTPNKNEESSQQKERQDVSRGNAIREAHEQADQDMEKDSELTAGSPSDDLDEGETARLGGDKNDLV